MSERIVTTIGDLGERPPVRMRRRARFADDLDQMLGITAIGDFTMPPPEGGEDPNTIILPETVITSSPDDDTEVPEEWAVAVGPAEIAPAGGTPKPAVPSKAAWSRGDGSYILQAGNTLWGLATTYLTSGARWREIWNAQTAAYRTKHTPDRIYAGEVIAMPSEAQSKARGMGLYGVGSDLIGQGFSGKQIAAGAAGVGVLGVLAYLVGKP